MFIGEAPGKLEDKTGLPFQGKAGGIFDRLVRSSSVKFQWMVTNMVCCQPVDVIYIDNETDDDFEGDLDKLTSDDYQLDNWNRNPEPSEINLCKGHIEELQQVFKPDGVILLGDVAKRHKSKYPRLELLHPAYILRQEYKLITLNKQVRKMDDFIKRLI